MNAINLRRSPLTLEALLTLCRAPAASSPLVAPLGVVHLRNEKRAFAVQPCAGAPPEDFGETPSYGHLSLEAFEELELLSTSPLAILSFGLVLARRSRPPHDSGWVAARNIVTRASASSSNGSWRGLAATSFRRTVCTRLPRAALPDPPVRGEVPGSCGRCHCPPKACLSSSTTRQGARILGSCSRATPRVHLR